ncbi:hypothetical protein [Enterovirga sp.]|uniref:hypothetical protein n=1 Tax=Enterovirga sp. TaxID=2026350 RepID=UPI0026254527|nr:hypothetical protein [Enterovirga sp.]MDB5592091.1 hypothetical protein [Enterovirga sp.]
MRWIMVGIGALMSLLAAAYLARGFGSAWARSYLVTFDRPGLFCPKLFRDKVPWSAIEHVGLRRTRDLDSYLVVSVPDSVRYPPVPGRALQAASVLKTGDPLSLDVGPLEGTPADIEAAIRHFAPRPVSGPPS